MGSRGIRNRQKDFLLNYIQRVQYPAAWHYKTSFDPIRYSVASFGKLGISQGFNNRHCVNCLSFYSDATIKIQNVLKTF